VIEIKNITKKFDNNLVFKNLNLEIKPGLIYGIVGVNGAGKTTLLKSIAGLFDLEKGIILVNGESNVKKKANSKIGYVPEQSALYDYLTGEEYLLFAASTFGLEKRAALNSINDILGKLNLIDAKNELISTYSNGMKQKIAIASALLKKPEYLLLDEPLTGIDLITSQQIRKYLNDFAKTKSVLMTTHLLELAHSICDTVLILHRNEIVEVFDPKLYKLKDMEEKINQVYLSQN
jgi:ABC-2 type transport system ATP-binding protein